METTRESSVSGRIGLVALAALAVLVLLPVAPSSAKTWVVKGGGLRPRRRDERLRRLRLRQARLGLQADHRPLLPQASGSRRTAPHDRVRVLLGLALRRRPLHGARRACGQRLTPLAHLPAPSAAARACASYRSARQAARELRQAPPRQGRAASSRSPASAATAARSSGARQRSAVAQRRQRARRRRTTSAARSRARSRRPGRRRR